MNKHPSVQKNYDIIIAGAGITGCALALLLANEAKQQAGKNLQPWRTLLVDQRAPFAAPRAFQEISKPARVSTINRSELYGLVDAGLQPKNIQLCPVEQLEVWENKGTGHFSLDCKAINLEAMAYVIENNCLVGALLESLNKSPHVDVQFDSGLHGIKPESPREITSIFKDHASTQSQLLVGADGVHSKIRELSNIATEPTMEKEYAIVAELKVNDAHNNIARQVFLGNSILAFLPLADNKSKRKNAISIVWSGPQALLEKMAQLPEKSFEAIVTQHGNSLRPNTYGAMQLISSRSLIPITPQTSKHIVKSNIVLVGDAAHTIHPLAGQGANLGLSDCQALTTHLARAWQQSIPLGNLYWLRRYERARKAEIAKMNIALKTVKHAYNGNHHWLWSLIRNAGTRQFNRTTFWSNWVMKEMQNLSRSF